MTFVQNNKKERDEVYTKEWRVGEYNRLSKEDGDKPESDSIQNQHKINQNHIDYLRRQGENIVSVTVYSDDGYAGGTFERPKYKDLIRDIECGKINCVIFKDNSRLGRNYPELGRLMEDYFPQKGVRVISVLNNLDSVKDPRGYCSAIVSFSNIVNDDYIRQLSIKIKSTLAMKRERGEFLGTYAPYGYQKDPTDRHKLIVDPEASEVVHMIFDWFEDGMSIGRIVKKLNALQIAAPSEYKKQNGEKGFITAAENNPKTMTWGRTTVGTILRNEVYIGNLVQGKHKSASYRTKKRVAAEQENWSVVEGTHEPIISYEQFSIVHDRLEKHTRVSPYNEATYLLSGFVICGHCGHHMGRTHNGVKDARYRCNLHLRAPDKCQCTSVKEGLLKSVVLEALQQQIEELVDAKAVIDQARSATRNPNQNEYAMALKKVEREKEKLSEAKFKLYFDYQSGLISQEDYLQFGKRFESAIAEQDSNMEKIQKSIAELQDSRRLDDEFIEYFRAYGNINDLNREIMNHLIDRVVYYDKQHIEIFFRFSDTRQKIFDMASAIVEPA